MANIKSAIKRAQMTKTRTLRNKAVRSQVRSATRRVAQAVAESDGDAGAQALRAAMSTIDRAARKGVLHPRAAARKKSRLAKRLNKLGA